MQLRTGRAARVLFLSVAVTGFAVAAWAGPFHRRCPPPDCPCVAPPETTADAEAAVRQVLDGQVAAWNHGDLDGFMAGYWSSSDLTFFSGPDRTAGWQATLDSYRKRYQADGKEMGRLAFGDVKVDVLGSDYALARGSWRLELAKEKPGGLFTLVFRRLPEGWRIIHDHTSK